MRFRFISFDADFDQQKIALHAAASVFPVFGESVFSREVVAGAETHLRNSVAVVAAHTSTPGHLEERKKHVEVFYREELCQELSATKASDAAFSSGFV